MNHFSPSTAHSFTHRELTQAWLPAKTTALRQTPKPTISSGGSPFAAALLRAACALCIIFGRRSRCAVLKGSSVARFLLKLGVIAPRGGSHHSSPAGSQVYYCTAPADRELYRTDSCLHCEIKPLHTPVALQDVQINSH